MNEQERPNEKSEPLPSPRDRIIAYITSVIDSGIIQEQSFEVAAPDGSKIVLEVSTVRQGDQLPPSPKSVSKTERLTEKGEFRMLQERNKLTTRLIKLLNSTETEEEIIRNVLVFIKEFTGFESAGLRFLSEPNAPRIVSDNTPDGDSLGHDPTTDAFRQMTESTLRGEAVHPSLFSSEGGSYWTNRFLEQNVSITSVSYESIALIPLRAKSELIGLLHLSDARKELLDPDLVEFLEGMSGCIGQAIKQRRDEETLRRAYQELEQHAWRQTEEMAEIQKQLAQAQKMEAIGRLAGGVAHDFNNSLAVIKAYGEFIRSTLYDMRKQPPDAKTIEAAIEDAQMIVEACKKAAALTMQLLILSRKQKLQKCELSINEVVDETDKILQRTIGEDISLVTTLEPEMSTTIADKGQLQQVLMNLCINSRDAMPQGGTLSINTRELTIDEDFCRTHPQARPGRFICLTVSDTGSGMDEETRRHAFEPFYTTKKPGKGTGLGLSLVYGIVTQHDGWITLKTAPEEGTKFDIYIPILTQLVKEDERAPTASFESLRGNGERVLIAEDDEAVREVLVRILEENGYIPVPAANGEEACKILDDETSQIQVAISDHLMPGKSGIELVEFLRSKKPDISIVLVTGYGDERLQDVQRAGVPWCMKPFEKVELLQKVKHAMEAVGKHAAD